MESFCGDYVPRPIPKPSSFIKDEAQPTVPEVSLIFSKNNQHDISKNATTKTVESYPSSYNAWKLKSNIIPVSSEMYNLQKLTLEGKENQHNDFLTNSDSQICTNAPTDRPNTSSIFKKQVRFENPQGYETNYSSRNQYNSPQTIQHQNYIQHFNYSQVQPKQPLTQANIRNIDNIMNKPNISKPELDLSLLEPRKSLDVRSHDLNSHYNRYTPNTLSSFKNNLTNNQVTNIINNTQTEEYVQDRYISHQIDKRKSYEEWLAQNPQQFTPTSNYSHMHSKTEPVNKNEPTISDLFKIIQTQTEQIKALQSQVERLVQNTERKKYTTDVSTQTLINIETVSVQTDTEHAFTIPKKISVGLMTDLDSQKLNEIKPEERNNSPKLGFIQQSYNNRNEAKTFETSNIENNEYYKTNEITTTNQTNDYSINFNAPLEIWKPTSQLDTPMNSIHVDMQDYSSSSDSSDDEDELQHNNANIGWTVYNNVVGQVKNILGNKLNERVLEPIQESDSGENTDMKIKKQQEINNIVETVKNATLQQLRSLGISFVSPEIPGIPRNLEPTCDKNFEPSDLSIEVNQLVMKYLQNDQLSQYVTRNLTHTNQQNGLGITGNEVSFATIKYMQKYNLLNNPAQAKPVQDINHTPRRPILRKGSIEQNKILDITALKKQPKLL